MVRKLLIQKLPKLFVGIVLVTSVGLIDWYFQNLSLSKIFNSLLAITVSYFIIMILFQVIVAKAAIPSRTKYSLRKVLTVVFYFTVVIALITVWVEDTESLVLSYSLVSAGFAVALQDTIKNFFGGLTIYLGNLFEIGDRIEVDGQTGDVIDIGMLFTSILEIKNWIGGDQATGRINHIPNHKILTMGVQNYTKDHKFIWDEIMIPLTYESNRDKAEELILRAVAESTTDVINMAQTQLRLMGNKYFLQEHTTNPVAFFKVTDNWVEMHVRYIASTFERREIASEINRSVVNIASSHDDINISTESIRVFSNKETHSKNRN